jgi:hypothetical protein
LRSAFYDRVGLVWALGLQVHGGADAGQASTDDEHIEVVVAHECSLTESREDTQLASQFRLQARRGLPFGVRNDAARAQQNRYRSGQPSSVLAEVDVTFSTFLTEAWWRSPKHHWLYRHQIDSLTTCR